MTDSHEITTTAPAQIQSDKQTRTHPLVTIAMQQQGLDPSTLRDLMSLQREWEEGEAKRAYTMAMTKLKAEMPSVIEREREVSFGGTHYKFTSLAKAMDVVTPHLSKNGFSISWKSNNNGDYVSVTCSIVHSGGHHEETTLSGPVDKSGGKNAIQAVGSTVTYLQRYTALSLLGIATADMTEPHKSNDDKVDAAKNLQAVATLKQCDVTLEQACNHVGKDVRQWTLADLEKLRELVRTNRQQPTEESHDAKNEEATEIEQLRAEVIEKARKKWGDDGMIKLGQLLRSNGTTISDAGLDALNWALEEMR
jgi:hypothetical protein